jgi:hypothetical protein
MAISAISLSWLEFEQDAQQLVKERTGAKKRKGDNDENV